MRKFFQCLYCNTLVTPEKSHYACQRTCGSPECQKKLNAETIKHCDQLRQQRKIDQLKAQGIDLVICQICKEEFEMIHYAHLKKHGLTVTEYREKFPDSQILNSRIYQIKSNTAINRSQYLDYDAKPIDSRLCEFFTGSLLGDGSLERRSLQRNARYAEGGNNQKYLMWKKIFLDDYFSCTFKERLSSPHTKTGKQYRGWWLRTKVHPALTDLHSIWYLPHKILPKDFINTYLTEFALSIWFYDDGYLSDSGWLYTMSFAKDEVAFLSDLLCSRFQLKNSILKNKNGQYFIRISAYSRIKLLEILQKYPISGMEYKRTF